MMWCHWYLGKHILNHFNVVILPIFETQTQKGPNYQIFKITVLRENIRQRWQVLYSTTSSTASIVLYRSYMHAVQ
jgi:hypothetical protein